MRSSNQPLRRGDRGDDVRQAQQWLNDAGMNISVDGIFGPRTERALAAYQQRLVQRGLLEPEAVRPGLFDEATRMATLADAWQRGMSEIRSMETANSGATLNRALQVALRYSPSSQPQETTEPLIPSASISAPPGPPRRR